jgi:hypothetical protein
MSVLAAASLQVLMPHRTPYRPIQMTVPETPSPEVLAAQQAALAKKAAGPGRHVSDTTPSKGRMAKTQRMEDAGSSECCALHVSVLLSQNENQHRSAMHSAVATPLVSCDAQQQELLSQLLQLCCCWSGTTPGPQ